MAYDSFNSAAGVPPVTPWVKRLMIANVAMFALLVFGGAVRPELAAEAEAWLVVWRETVLYRPWTMLTYAFVHGGLGHIFFNMLALYFFAPRIEEHWGARPFLMLYAVSTIAAAALALLMPNPVLGASGAIYGVMLAYAALWPNDVVHVWGIFPVKVKWFVAVLAAVSVVLSVQDGGGNISYLAHLGGMLGAAAYLKSPWAPATQWASLQRPAARPPRALSAVRPAKDSSRAPMSNARATEPLPQSRHEQDIDRILDKISTSGIASLTEDERRILQDASRQRRGG